jgi:hypothetical protein
MLGHVVQPKIFSRAGLSLRDCCENGSRQNCIHDVSGMVEREPEPDDRERFEIRLQ